MTILQSLAGYYDRMAARGEAEPPGFSRERIGFAVVIDEDGVVVAVDDLRDASGKKPVAMLRDVPASQKRTVAVVPNFLWDKTAYSLGATAGEGKRTAQEHAAFCDLHLGLLADASDVGLLALRRFLEGWTPDRFASAPFRSDMLDANFVFRLDGDRDDGGRPRLIHERDAARPLIEGRGVEGEGGWCLIAGSAGPIARLHPVIKNVDGAQSSGAALVSFNLDAFASWGREQGANAPTGQAAAARYGAALNRLLDRGGANRMRIGDATVAFWADTSGSGERAAQEAESLLAGWFASGVKISADQDAAEAARIRQALEPIAKGRPVAIDGVEVSPDTKVHILGLSPNAARLSVRFWLTETLGDLAANLAAHERDCRIDPRPWKRPPSVNRLLVNTVAAQEKWDNIPPLLAGEVARAVLGGTRYPRTWLSNAIMRLRAGDDPASGWHAAAIRAVLRRLEDKRTDDGGGAPVSLDKQETNPAYRLGRLFAVLEAAQYNALGRVNATIRDRYFGAASATPASVFPLLMRGGQNHLAVLRKEGKAGGIERDLEEIVGGLATQLPRALKLEDQGRFAIGYYHQRAARFVKKDAAAMDAAEPADGIEQGNA